MENIEELKSKFESEAAALVERVKNEVYNPTRFLKMGKEYGYYEATKRVINNGAPADGFIKLLERGRVELAVENLVIKENYKPLFTKEEITWCQKLFK